jgi:CBS domain-containing protein
VVIAMTVGELCTGNVVVARPSWSVVEAAQRMAEYEVGDVVVVSDDGTGTLSPVGVLTDRDLVVKVLARFSGQYNEITIGSVMTRPLMTALESDDLSDVIARMREHCVRRVPVLNKNGGLEGILSYDDIVEWLSDQMESLATVARAAKSSVL